MSAVVEGANVVSDSGPLERKPQGRRVAPLVEHAARARVAEHALVVAGVGDPATVVEELGREASDRNRPLRLLLARGRLTRSGLWATKGLSRQAQSRPAQ
jgi:hypothetical protein